MEENQKVEMQISKITQDVTNFSSRESLWNYYFTTWIFSKGEMTNESAILADKMLEKYDARFGEKQNG